eukprot:GFUD01103816.1.p2 GENE.GFUD01103816.1~~GFUD01103816.1.p2  ORF type:complete len:128 (-),score=38.07 GFUD01103816.1:31-414(-)
MSDWFLIQTANGLVLDVAGGVQGGKLIIYQKHGGDNQLWRFEEGRLVNKIGMVADIMAGSTEEEAEVIAWEKHDGDNQKWSMKENYIHSELTDMVMDLKEGQMEEGAEVIMFPKHGGSNQMWFVYPL